MAGTTISKPRIHTPQDADRNQCAADSLWYSCTDLSCEGVRGCYGEPAKLHCACPPFNASTVRPRLAVLPPAPLHTAARHGPIVVIQSVDKNFAASNSVIDRVLRHNQRWATARGYRYVVHSYSTRAAMPSRAATVATAKFQRYALLLAALRHHYWASVYLDADAVISHANGSLPVSATVPVLLGNELTVQAEHNRHFNTGFIMLQNTPLSHSFLRAILNDDTCAACRRGACGPQRTADQGCIDKLLRGSFAAKVARGLIRIAVVQAPRPQPGRLITHTPGIFRNWSLLSELAGQWRR